MNLKTPALAILIFLVSFFSFTFSVRYFNTTDSYPNNFTALNLLFNNRLDLTNLKEEITKRGIISVTVTNSQGLLYPKTPPLLGILSVPAFAFLNSYYHVSHLTPAQIVFSDYNQYIGKLSASFYCALSAAILFLILLKINKNRFQSTILAAVYVFGTDVFNTASQANWQHGISLFAITLFLYLIIFRRNILTLIASGLLLGLLGQIRISNLFYLPFPLILLFLRHPKDFKTKWLVFFTALLFSFTSVSLTYRFLNIPYGYENEIISSLTSISLVQAIKVMLSLLFSFNSGLFTFSPVLLLALPGIFPVPKSTDSDEKTISFSLLPTLALFFLFLSVWKYWLGGTSLNARLLTETLPVWVIFLNYSFEQYQNSPQYKTIFIILFTFSVFLNILTTFFMNWWWFPLYTQGTAKSQLRDTWFARPALISYLVQTRFLNWQTLYRHNDQLILHSLIFRPDFKRKFLLKLEDKKIVILNLHP